MTTDRLEELKRILWIAFTNEQPIVSAQTIVDLTALIDAETHRQKEQEEASHLLGRNGAR